MILGYDDQKRTQQVCNIFNQLLPDHPLIITVYSLAK